MSVILRPRSSAYSAMGQPGQTSARSLAAASVVGAIVLALVLGFAIPVSADQAGDRRSALSDASGTGSILHE